MNIRQLIDEEQQEEEQAMIAQLRQGNCVRAFKTRRRTKAGAVLYIWLNATALGDGNGKPCGLVTTEWDLAWLPEG
jgi:hypothetical protein